MCDYSLAHFPNRLAVEGEELIIHRFSSRTRGLASPGDVKEGCSTTAVCVPPGARLILRDIPGPMQQEFGVSEIEEVTFIEQSADAFRHRDGVRFANGQAVLLQRLPCGLRVRVLSLDSADTQQQPERRIEASMWVALGPIL